MLLNRKACPMMLGNGHASRNFQFCGPENSHKSSAFGECISKNIQTNAGRTRRSVFSTLVLLSKWSLQLEIYCCMDLVMHRQISCVAVNLRTLYLSSVQHQVVNWSMVFIICKKLHSTISLTVLTCCLLKRDYTMKN